VDYHSSSNFVLPGSILLLQGLRYEDLLNENEHDIAEAIELADPEVKIGRTRRLKRALDLDVKHKNLNDYAPNMDQETFRVELYDDVLKIRARDQEFALLNQHKK
jgi:ubiquinol-cytochrome c reductase subunit 7